MLESSNQQTFSEGREMMNTDNWISGLSLFALLVVTGIILWFSELHTMLYSIP
jgi:hypothetical protein